MEDKPSKKKKKIIKSTQRIVKNFAPALLGSINPALALLAGPLQAIMGYWGDYANDKTRDLLKDFIENKDRIITEVVQSDKFTGSFLKIISQNITETNEEKRQYLKNYILNMACKVNPDFNEHTKLIATLNTITLEEIEMLKIWDQNGARELWINKGEVHAQDGLRSMALDINEIERLVRTTGTIFQLPIGDNDRPKNNQILLSLGYKDLLYVLSKSNFGSGQEALVKDITDFGKTFLSFIKR